MVLMVRGPSETESVVFTAYSVPEEGMRNLILRKSEGMQEGSLDEVYIIRQSKQAPFSPSPSISRKQITSGSLHIPS